MGPDGLAGGGNPWRRLRGEFEVELPDEQLLVGVQFRVPAEKERATVSRREVNIKHLDRGELIEDCPWGQASSQRPEPGAQGDMKAVGHERDEDVSLDALDSLMVNWA